MARALWKGELKLGDVRVPVKLVSARAPESTFDVGFHFAHRCSKKTLTRINKKTWCATCEKHVDETVRVIEYAAGKHIEIDNADLKACEAEDNGLLNVVAKFDDDVHPALIDSVAYMVPFDAASASLFNVVRTALDYGTLIAKCTLYKRERHVAIATNHDDGAMVVCVLRPLTQRVHVASVDDNNRPMPVLATDPDYRRVQQQLRALPKHFALKQVRDEYRERVNALVRTKTAALMNPARKRRAS